jgi:hypothetical protein
MSDKEKAVGEPTEEPELVTDPQEGDADVKQAEPDVVIGPDGTAHIHK